MNHLNDNCDLQATILLMYENFDKIVFKIVFENNFKNIFAYRILRICNVFC